jgi:hypothetical protein
MGFLMQLMKKWTRKVVPLAERRLQCGPAVNITPLHCADAERVEKSIGRANESWSDDAEHVRSGAVAIAAGASSTGSFSFSFLTLTTL